MGNPVYIYYVLCIYTRLLGHFAPIFHFHCEHVLFVYIEEKIAVKNFFFVDFHKKFGPERFSRFDVYWIQTNKHTNRQTPKQTDSQAKFIYRYMINRIEEGDFWGWLKLWINMYKVHTIACFTALYRLINTVFKYQSQKYI